MNLEQISKLYDELTIKINNLESTKMFIESTITKDRLLREVIRDQLKQVLKDASFEEIDSISREDNKLSSGTLESN